ncbi:Mu transposase C-terminal domain-containing protein [Chitiniphilus eburneus]|uniref:Transposase n=1 Tax=Chitiniphilus eburneus TaxID=2571148 RepID=A0A4U0Q8F7_9NEIS|nr:Mu transposase C-terminal domain-containing protein [Chitiniphilus eburneus]TJZ77526.1 transposase [Chitiniphilus eburneus]
MNTIRPGQLAYWRDQAVVVLEIKGLTEAVIRTVSGNATEVVPVSSLYATPAGDSAVPQGKHLLAKDKDWEVAMGRYELIQPLLDANSGVTVYEVAERAEKSIMTIYRWLNRFKETGLVSSLLRTPRADKGASRLDAEVESIVQTQIDRYYLKMERPSVAKLYKQIREQCDAADLPPPDRNTVYARVRKLDRRLETTKRYGYKAAREKLDLLRGQFPDADFPNAVGQIDHTPVDVIVVDDEFRRPIGRPSLTLAIDANSRMVGGFYMSLDPAGTLSAGLCIGRAIMRKELWLAKMDIHAPWPIYGKMAKIHLDGAKEFRGKTLRRACDEYGILIEHRRKGHPNYGPHIERAFRTFMGQVQELPGTTFSNVQLKADYDSEGRACMTLSELDCWFTTFLVYEYHNQPQKDLGGLSPIQFYKQCVHGNAERPGVGLPLPISNEEKLRLDFLPFELRTIQRDGVVMDNIQYSSPVLRRWIDASDPENPRLKRKFLFARDPRDISVIYFLDPEDNTYHPIPYFNASRPAISIWELRAAARLMKSDPAAQIDEDAIFEGVRRRRQIQEQAIEKTRLARKAQTHGKRALREAQRRKGWAGLHTAGKPLAVAATSGAESGPGAAVAGSEMPEGAVGTAFSEIEVEGA